MVRQLRHKLTPAGQATWTASYSKDGLCRAGRHLIDFSGRSLSASRPGGGAMKDTFRSYSRRAGGFRVAWALVLGAVVFSALALTYGQLVAASYGQVTVEGVGATQQVAAM